MKKETEKVIRYRDLSYPVKTAIVSSYVILILELIGLTMYILTGAV